MYLSCQAEKNANDTRYHPYMKKCCEKRHGDSWASVHVNTNIKIHWNTIWIPICVIPFAIECSSKLTVYRLLYRHYTLWTCHPGENHRPAEPAHSRWVSVPVDTLRMKQPEKWYCKLNTDACSFFMIWRHFTSIKYKIYWYSNYAAGSSFVLVIWQPRSMVWQTYMYMYWIKDHKLGNRIMKRVT